MFQQNEMKMDAHLKKKEKKIGFFDRPHL